MSGASAGPYAKASFRGRPTTARTISTLLHVCKFSIWGPDRVRDSEGPHIRGGRAAEGSEADPAFPEWHGVAGAGDSITMPKRQAGSPGDPRGLQPTSPMGSLAPPRCFRDPRVPRCLPRPVRTRIRGRASNRHPNGPVPHRGHSKIVCAQLWTPGPTARRKLRLGRGVLISLRCRASILRTKPSVWPQDGPRSSAGGHLRTLRVR